ncbi:MAG: hypothetical protein PVG27_08050, partial [Chloroflexota bacterium]
NHLLETARGSYFMWASDHDLWDPQYVEVLAGALESDHRAVLAYGETVLIDESGSELGLMDDLVDVSASGARQRYCELIWRIGPCNMAYGLMRLDAARSTWGILPILGPDNLLLAQMALRGRFQRVGSPLFFRRQNRPVEADPETERAQQLERLHGANQAYRSPSRIADMTELRDQHLRLVHGEFSGFDRLLADLTTRHAFLDRLGVPDVLGSTLHLRHRVTGRLRRWQRQLAP